MQNKNEKKRADLCFFVSEHARYNQKQVGTA